MLVSRFDMLFASNFPMNFLWFLKSPSELPQSVAAAVAEGKLNPITMQHFDYLPNAEMCSESVSVLSYYRTSGDELRISFTEGSCITMCSSEQDHEEHIEDKLIGKLTSSSLWAASNLESNVYIFCHQTLSTEKLLVKLKGIISKQTNPEVYVLALCFVLCSTNSSACLMCQQLQERQLWIRSTLKKLLRWVCWLHQQSVIK